MRCALLSLWAHLSANVSINNCFSLINDICILCIEKIRKESQFGEKSANRYSGVVKVIWFFVGASGVGRYWSAIVHILNNKSHPK